MQFFSDLVSALTRLAGDDVNISQEISNLQAAEAKFEADVQAQTLASINAQVGPAVTAALAAQGFTSDAMTSLTARVQAIENDEAAADKDIPPAPVPPAPPVALSVTPTSISSAVGAAISQTLTVSGGTAPYTFDSSLADVLVDASGNVTGTPAAAETGDIVVGDSASPSNTVSVAVTIS